MSATTHPRDAARQWITAALTDEHGSRADAAAISTHAATLDEVAAAYRVPTEEIVRWLHTDGRAYLTKPQEQVEQAVQHCQWYQNFQRAHCAPPTE